MGWARSTKSSDRRVANQPLIFQLQFCGGYLLHRTVGYLLNAYSIVVVFPLKSDCEKSTHGYNGTCKKADL